MAKKFRVEISAANPAGSLRPGTFGTVVLEVAAREAVLVLPQKAIVGDKYVFLAENGRAVRREVTLGLQNADLVEILDGLKEGDRGHRRRQLRPGRRLGHRSPLKAGRP